MAGTCYLQPGRKKYRSRFGRPLIRSPCNLSNALVNIQLVLRSAIYSHRYFKNTVFYFKSMNRTGDKGSGRLRLVIHFCIESNELLSSTFTIGHFSQHVDDVGQFEWQFVRLRRHIRVDSLHLRTVPFFVDLLLGIVRRSRRHRLQPTGPVRFRRAREDLSKITPKIIWPIPSDEPSGICNKFSLWTGTRFFNVF